MKTSFGWWMLRVRELIETVDSSGWTYLQTKRGTCVYFPLRFSSLLISSSIFNVTTSKELEMLERIGSKINSAPCTDISRSLPDPG